MSTNDDDEQIDWKAEETESYIARIQEESIARTANAMMGIYNPMRDTGSTYDGPELCGR